MKKSEVVWDMHGSFTRDFVYRVDHRFKGMKFFNLQESFVFNLAKYGRWQKGNFQISNGAPGMSRIRLINRFGLNALTHETPREIEIGNRKGRTLLILKEQGRAIAKTLIK